MNRITLLLLASGIYLTCHASVFLPSDAQYIGGTPDQSFALHTAMGRGLYSTDLTPVTIKNGETTLEDALSYTAPSQGRAGGPFTNGRFNGSVGSVKYHIPTLDLDGLLFWNYSESVYNERGLLSADISITTAHNTTTLPGVSFALTPDRNHSVAQQIAFADTLCGVTEIEFSNIVSDSSQFAGWQQVAVYQIPEPMTAALLCMLVPVIIFRRNLSCKTKNGTGKLYIQLNHLFRTFYKETQLSSSNDRWL